MTQVQADPRLEAALDCIDMFYARMFRDWPGAIVRTEAEYTLSYSGDARLTGANHLWPHTPGALSDGALDAAAAFFEPYNAAWSTVYTDTFSPQAARFLAERGYFIRWNSRVMVLDRLPYQIGINPALEVIRATTPRHLAGMGMVMSEAFATQRAVNERVARPAHLDDPHILHYLIYTGGEPATCATVVLCDHMAGIWNVGTRRPFRRQRYATTIMYAVLDDLARQGYTATMLMASPGGQPLYEQLGYRHVGSTYYMGPPYIVRTPTRH